MLRAVIRVVVVSAVLVAFIAFPTRRARAAARKPVTLGIVFHVADFEGKPVADDAFLDRRLARTNEIYAPYGVSFTRVGTVKLDERHARIQDRDGRDALAADVSPRGDGVIDCFVVRSFKDVGDPLIYRRGVHWHVKSRPGCHFVMLSAFGDVDVLAHELGHFLGNPQHKWEAGNLMSYARGSAPELDARQRNRLETALRGYLRRRELRAVAPSAAAASAQAKL
jgi:hypothetical protein